MLDALLDAQARGPYYSKRGAIKNASVRSNGRPVLPHRNQRTRRNISDIEDDWAHEGPSAHRIL